MNKNNLYGDLYDKYVTAYSDSFERVFLDDIIIKKIDNFVSEKIVRAKVNEPQHKIDPKSEQKRFVTGLLGEAALEKLLGIPIIDWTVGESKKYNHPDILKYNIGAKTVEKFNFPIIFKRNWYPQIICIRSDKFENLIFVCGLATPEILNKYQSDGLILDSNLRLRNTKTGFYGFKYLIPIHSLKDIEKYNRVENAFIV